MNIYRGDGGDKRKLGYKDNHDWFDNKGVVVGRRGRGAISNSYDTNTITIGFFGTAHGARVAMRG